MVSAAVSQITLFLLTLAAVSFLVFLPYKIEVSLYKEIWSHSKLTSAGVKTVCDKKSCSYIGTETFEHYVNGTGTGNYCTVERETYFPTYGSAQNFASSRKLGTFRKIYVYSLTSLLGSCLDEKLVKYYNDVSFTMLAVFLSSLIGIFVLVILSNMAENLENMTSRGIDYNDRKTNWSSPYCFKSWNLYFALADTNGDGNISTSELLAALGGTFKNILSEIYSLFGKLKLFLQKYLCCQRTSEGEQENYTTIN